MGEHAHPLVAISNDGPRRASGLALDGRPSQEADAPQALPCPSPRRESTTIFQPPVTSRLASTEGKNSRSCRHPLDPSSHNRDMAQHDQHFIVSIAILEHMTPISGARQVRTLGPPGPRRGSSP
jgi:hypothetical protein